MQIEKRNLKKERFNNKEDLKEKLHKYAGGTIEGHKKSMIIMEAARFLGRFMNQ